MLDIGLSWIGTKMELRVSSLPFAGAPFGHSRAEDLGGFTVRSSDPCCVDAKCGCASAAVPEAAGDGGEVDSGGE